MPSDAAALRQALERALNDGGTVTLEPSLGEPVADLLELLNTERLVISGARLDPGPGTVPTPRHGTLSGTAELWKAADAPVVLTLTEDDSGGARLELSARPARLTFPPVADSVLPLAPGAAAGLSDLAFSGATVDAAVPAGTLLVHAPLADAWSPLGLTGVSLTRAAMRLAVARDPKWGEVRRARLTATLSLGTREIPVRVEVPLGAGTWTVGLDGRGVRVNLLSDLAPLLAGADYAAAVPEPVARMAELSLHTLQVRFDPGGPSWSAVELGLETGQPWEIGAGVSLRKVGLSLSLRPGKRGPVLTGSVYGSLAVGKLTFAATVPIPLAGTLLLTGATREPFTFADLAGLVDAGWAEALPGGVEGPGLEIHQMWLGYDLSLRQVQSVGIDVGSVGRWTVIPRWLEMQDLRFRVNATRSGDSWGISGSAGGTLIVAKTRVSAAIQGGNGEWWLGLTEPLELPSVGDVAELIGGKDVASVLPAGVATLGALTVYQAEIAFGGENRGVRRVAIGFRTREPWKAWTPYFVLTSLDVAVRVDEPAAPGRRPDEPAPPVRAGEPAPPARRLDASVHGAFNVAGVDVFVSAEHRPEAKGWQLEGRTGPDQEIPVGELVAWLAKKFGVDAPKSVSSFELHDLAVAFNTGTRAFLFDCEGSFELVGREIDLALHVDVKPPAAGVTEAGKEQDGTAQGALPGEASGASTAVPAPARPADAPAARAEKPSGFELDITGTLRVGTSKFRLQFEMEPESTRFTAEWTAETDPKTGKQTSLGFEQIAELFGYEMPEIPPGVDLALVEASFSYDFKHKRLALTAKSLNYGAAVFVADAGGAKTRYLFALELQSRFGLRQLPVVGPAIPAELAFELDAIGLWLASAPVNAADAGSIGTLIPTGLPQVPAAGLGAGPTLSLHIALGEAKHTLTLGTAAPSTDRALQATSPDAAGGANALAGTATASTRIAAPGPDVSASTVTAPPPPARAEAPSDGTSWIDVQKTLGPLSVQRLGFRYSGGRVTVLFDGGLAIAGIGFTLYGLQVSSALRPPLNLAVGLDGLGLQVNRDPLLIAGAFMRVSPPPAGFDWQYAGMLAVRASEFGLGAVGAYGSAGGVHSMFVFATLDAPLGGVPAFFVMGLSGGLGINARVTLPGPDQVQDFPFVAGLGNPDALGGADAGPLDVLKVLQGRSTVRPGPAWVTAAPGQVWIAAGIQFTSFKVVTTRALVVANLGERDISFALLGISAARLPPAGPVIFARVELQLAAVFKPLEGFIGVSAVLSRNSYLLHPNCRLTGGFAFFLWFAGEHAGDFVLSVGGYHPRFVPPAHYPRLERLGFNWQVSTLVTIKGGAYFALTPSCIMAGVGLEATFRSGPLTAWFRANADFLAQWHPFHFEADVGVSVGVSFRLNLLVTTVTLSVEIGAELRLWGPPTGGEVHVDWYVISFTIPFGEPRPTVPSKVDWTGFRTLLPPDDALLTLSAQGLQKGDDDAWVARPDEFAFTTRSAIPATELRVARSERETVRHQARAAGDLSIRPMRQTSVQSPQTLTVTRDGQVLDLSKEQWTVESETQNQPEALWGVPLAGARPAAPAATLMPGELAGFRVRPPRARAGASPGPIDVAGDLGYDPVHAATTLPFGAAAHTGRAAFAEDGDTVARIAAQAGAEGDAARADAFAALAALGAAPSAAGSLAGVARDAELLFSEPPLRSA